MGYRFVLVLMLAFGATVSSAEEVRYEAILEVFLDKSEASHQARKVLSKLRKGQTININLRDLSKEPRLAERVKRITNKYGTGPPAYPVVFGCNNVICGFVDEDTFRKQLRELLTIRIFYKEGCPSCDEVHDFVTLLQRRYPTFCVELLDLGDSTIERYFQVLKDRHDKPKPELPTFYVANELIPGFPGPATTKMRFERTLKKWVREIKSKPNSLSTR